MYLDPTKKQDITKAHAAISLEYEPTIVSSISLIYLSFFVDLALSVIVE